MTKKRKAPKKSKPQKTPPVPRPVPPADPASMTLPVGWYKGIDIPDAPSDVEGGEKFIAGRKLSNWVHQYPPGFVHVPQGKRPAKPRAPRKPRKPPKPPSPSGSDSSDPGNGPRRRGWKKNGFRLFTQFPITAGVELYGYANLLGHTYYMRAKEVQAPGRPIYISGRLLLRH